MTKASVLIMSVEDWIAIPDNPIQRDTERHASKAKHLHNPLAPHRHVWAAVKPDGNILCKLDGHTRALMWKRNMIPRPSDVEVHKIEVKDREEAANLYKTFDSREALETTPDKVSGALRGMGLKAQSGLVQSGAIASALRLCWTGVYGFARELGPRDVYETINEFAAEILALDEMNLKKGDLPAGAVAAIILSYRKHGDEILPFWRAVLANSGTKSGGRMDGVQAVNELLISKKTYGGRAVTDMLSRCLGASEKWLAGETMVGAPRPVEFTAYLDTKGSKPKYKLVRKTKPFAASRHLNGNGATAQD